jgi:hypothetical protein
MVLDWILWAILRRRGSPSLLVLRGLVGIKGSFGERRL